MGTFHSPIVRIAGVDIDPGWSRVDASLLEAISIEWGADSHYDEVPPASLKLQIVIPSGQSMMVNYFQDRLVEIFTDLGRLYRGTISSTNWEEIYVWHEDEQENRRYWLVTLVAHDPTAQVRSFVPVARGIRTSMVTSQKGMWVAWDKYMLEKAQAPYFAASNHWYSAWAAMRHSVPEQIEEAGLVGSVSREYWAEPNIGFRLHTDGADAWQLLREVYGTKPLAEAAYDPKTNAIQPTYPTSERAEARLSYTSGKIRLALIAGTQAQMISADDLELPSGVVEASTDRILNVKEIEYQVLVATREVAEMMDLPRENPPTYRDFSARSMSSEKQSRVVPGARSGGSTYSRPLLMTMGVGPDDGFWDENIVRTDQNNLKTIAQQLSETADLVAKLNDRPTIPDLIFDWEESAPSVPQTLERLLLNATPIPFRSAPLVIRNAPVLQEIGIDHFGQVIGGSLKYQNGWRHQLRFAPITENQPAALTYAQLVTNSAATYDSFDEAISVSDFGIVTQGAS